MAKQSAARRPPRGKGPEKKIGPLAGGMSIAIWLNRIETDDGPRMIRSITIAPRRYKDRETGEWRDAPSLRPGDLPVLMLLLQKAIEYCYLTPLPDGASAEDGEREIPY